MAAPSPASVYGGGGHRRNGRAAALQCQRHCSFSNNQCCAGTVIGRGKDRLLGQIE
jgi:hypothetical protein